MQSHGGKRIVCLQPFKLIGPPIWALLSWARQLKIKEPLHIVLSSVTLVVTRKVLQTQINPVKVNLQTDVTHMIGYI